MPEETPPNLPAKKAPKWVRAYLAALCRVGVKGHAAELAKISYANVKLHRGAHPEFAAAEAEAMDEAADRLEREAVRRAHDGVEEPVFGKLEKHVVVDTRSEDEKAEDPHGLLIEPDSKLVTFTGEVGRIRKYSDTLLIFLLKGARPDKFADRKKTEHSGAVAVVPRTLADEIAAARAARPVEPPAAPAADLAPE